MNNVIPESASGNILAQNISTISIRVKLYEPTKRRGRGGDDQKIKKFDFFKTKLTNVLLHQMIIDENMQLGGLVSVSKRF